MQSFWHTKEDSRKPRIDGIIARVRRLLDYDRGRWAPYPRRDWFMILLIALFTLVVLGIVLLYLFYRYSPDRMVKQSINARTESSLIDLALLDRVLADFAHRKQEFNELLTASSTTGIDLAR